jgi:hypothetical protein
MTIEARVQVKAALYCYLPKQWRGWDLNPQRTFVPITKSVCKLFLLGYAGLKNQASDLAINGFRTNN